MKRDRLGLVVVFSVVGTALLGGWFGNRVNAESPALDQTQELLKTFTQALERIQANYARPVESNILVESAIKGMLRTLDPHSSYFTRTAYDDLQEEQKGKYYGLGILIRPEAPGSGRVVVVEPPAMGTPGQKAGLQPGDVIAKIEGSPTDDLAYPDEVIPKIKGPKGTKVNITIERIGVPEPIDLDIERDEIPLYSIKYDFPIGPRIGYIRIERFAETTSRELDQALERLDESNLEALILDLRNNPGGALSQAIAVSDRFLERDAVIVNTRSRSGESRSYRARNKKPHDYPMVVLINRHSASASEIVSGALQDHKRALVVGETSFGKALVQTIYPLEGSRGLALTTGKYYTPSDRLIQRSYSENFFDYYRSNRPSSEQANRNQSSDFSRGGIAPDVFIEPTKLSNFAWAVVSRNHVYSFSTELIHSDNYFDSVFKELVAGREQLTDQEKRERIAKISISDEILSSFKEFIEKREVEFTEEEFLESKEVIRSRIKREVLMGMFGDVEAYRSSLEIDDYVTRALELLPRARALTKVDQAPSGS